MVVAVGADAMPECWQFAKYSSLQILDNFKLGDAGLDKQWTTVDYPSEANGWVKGILLYFLLLL